MRTTENSSIQLGNRNWLGFESSWTQIFPLSAFVTCKFNIGFIYSTTELKKITIFLTLKDKWFDSLWRKIQFKRIPVFLQIRCEEIEKKEAKMKYINKLGKEITSESLNVTITEGIEEKLVTLNKRWRDTKEMLSDYRDKDEDERAEYGSCCCFQTIQKAFHACFYS